MSLARLTWHSNHAQALGACPSAGESFKCTAMNTLHSAYPAPLSRHGRKHVLRLYLPVLFGVVVLT